MGSSHFHAPSTFQERAAAILDRRDLRRRGEEEGEEEEYPIHSGSEFGGGFAWAPVARRLEKEE